MSRIKPIVHQPTSDVPPVLTFDGVTFVTATHNMSSVELDALENWFTHHPPTPEQVEQYQRIRDEGHRFAAVLTALIPPCADRTVAIRKVREAVMTANAAIACGGR